MKYLKNLASSLKEVFGIMFILYALLILSFFVFGEERATLGSYVVVFIFQLFYIIYVYRRDKIAIERRCDYFPFILLGVALAVIFNMTIFGIGIVFDVNRGIPVFLNVLSSSIVGPIFEEMVFRYGLTTRLAKFNSMWLTVILSGVIFGLCHANHISGIYGAIVGGINAFLFLRYKNILIPITLHISGNLIVNLLSCYNIHILMLSILLLIISILGIVVRDKAHY